MWSSSTYLPTYLPAYLLTYLRPQGFGFDVVELNASDARSKKALQACAEDLVGNTSIADFAAGGEQPTLSSLPPEL